MLSAISVGVTTPCLVSLCKISSIDSSLFRVLFWHSSQMNSRLTACKTRTNKWLNCFFTLLPVEHAAFVSFFLFPLSPIYFFLSTSPPSHPPHRALCQSSRGLLDVANSGQVQSCQSSGDVAADSDSITPLISGHPHWLPRLLIL